MPSDPAHPKQSSQWRRPDGTISNSRADALYLDGGQILELARASSIVVPPGLILGVCENETGGQGDNPLGCCYNQIDHDLDDNGEILGSTYGLGQVSRADAFYAIKIGAVLDPAAELTDPETNILVLAARLRSYAEKLASAAGVDVDDPPRELWAFTAAAHNGGMGVDADASSGKKRALAFVQTVGLNWSAIAANPPFGLTTWITTRLNPYVLHVLERVIAYPLASSSSSSPGSADNFDVSGNGEAAADSPTADVAPLLDPFTVRKFAAAAVLSLVIFFLWKVLA